MALTLPLELLCNKNFCTVGISQGENIRREMCPLNYQVLYRKNLPNTEAMYH